MYQLAVSVATLDQLYVLSGHLAELDFLSEPAAEQVTPAIQPREETREGMSGETPQSNSASEEPPATDRQINYLNDLALKAGWKLQVFEDAVTSLFNLEDLSGLTKQMASDLITWLQQDDFRPPLQD